MLKPILTYNQDLRKTHGSLTFIFNQIEQFFKKLSPSLNFWLPLILAFLELSFFSKFSVMQQIRIMRRNSIWQILKCL